MYIYIWLYICIHAHTHNGKLCTKFFFISLNSLKGTGQQIYNSIKTKSFQLIKYLDLHRLHRPEHAIHKHA